MRAQVGVVVYRLALEPERAPLHGPQRVKSAKSWAGGLLLGSPTGRFSS